jgi:predicted nucleotidyltransferase component of viral defense system
MWKRWLLMVHESRNMGASVRARLLDRSRAERSNFQILLTRYALERLLYRLSVSVHSESFILKGAMLFVTWVNDPFRQTRDLDLLGFGANNAEALAQTFRDICATEVPDDGVAFDIDGLRAAVIREEAEYGGVRVSTTATIDGARVPIQVDIGFGDTVTPGPVEIDYPTLLDSSAPHLRAYPVETVVAEKFEALVSLGIANTRLKDFYDLWLISQTFELQQPVLYEAVRRTFERRETALPNELPVGLSNEFIDMRSIQWRAFLGRELMAAAPDALVVVIKDLRLFLMPLVDQTKGSKTWPPRGPWKLQG